MGHGVGLTNPPVPNDGPSIHDLVVEDLAYLNFPQLIDDIKERKAFGLSKYGTILQANNQRCGWQEQYDEVLDAMCYSRKLMAEGDRRASSIYNQLISLASQIKEILTEV